MTTFLKSYEGQIYALLRITAGLLFLSHGSQKLLDFPASGPGNLEPLMLAAALIELVGGALIAVGFFTRWAAFLSSGQMAVAYWMYHGLQHYHPMLNKGELAVLYCFVFLFIAAKGPGMWSLDRAQRRS